MRKREKKWIRGLDYFNFGIRTFGFAELRLYLGNAKSKVE